MAAVATNGVVPKPLELKEINLAQSFYFHSRNLCIIANYNKKMHFRVKVSEDRNDQKWPEMTEMTTYQLLGPRSDILAVKNLLYIKSGDEGLFFRSVSASDMISSALICHQFSMGLKDYSVEIFEAIFHINTHGIAKPQRNDVDHVATVIDVFGHAWGVLWKTLWIN